MGPTTTNESLFRRAEKVSPGGVHGAARFYAPFPKFFQRMEGQYLWDVDDQRYLDLHGSFGAVALGHNDPQVRDEILAVLDGEGVLFGTPHPREVSLSEKLVSLVPCADMVALFGGGGSDPLYVGLRLARAFTSRSRVLKFEGEYHGWHDPLAVSVRPQLSEAGPIESPRAVPVSLGAAEGSASALIGVLNDSELLQAIFARCGSEIACAVIEPVGHTSGCIPIDRTFLLQLRNLCTEYGVVLMFDEVITGFRHSLNGAQALLGVTPDLAAFGKALSNGFALSALAGRVDLMSVLSPLGGAYYSGTFCGQTLAVAAAQATIDQMEKREIHRHTFALGDYVRNQLNDVAVENDIRAVCQSFGSVYCVYFGLDSVRQYRDVQRAAAAQPINRDFQRALLEAHIFMHPNFVNRSFITAAHTTEDVAHIVDATASFMVRNKERINRISMESGQLAGATG